MSAFDRFDFVGPRLVWPIPDASLIRLGQSVLADRDGTGQPHYGLDIYSPVDTPVLSVAPGRVLLVYDGRQSAERRKLRAGLWIEVFSDGLIYRYMHLGEALKKTGERVSGGTLLGFVGPNQAGDPHLHFEIRRGSAKGPALDPLKLLPRRRGTNVRV